MLSSKPKIYSVYLQRAKVAYEKPVIRASVELILSIFTVTFLLLVAIRPTLTTVAQLQKKIEDQEVVEKKLTSKINQLVRAQTQLAENSDTIELYKMAVTENYDYGELAKRVEILAKESGVTIELLSMPKVAITGPLISATAGDAKTKEVANKEGDVFKNEMGIAIKGDFGSVMKFLKTVEDVDRLMYFTSIKIKRIEDARNSADKGKLRVTAKMNSYYYPALTK